MKNEMTIKCVLFAVVCFAAQAQATEQAKVLATKAAKPSCATNQAQRLMCAKHPEGFIYLNRKGTALCSKGNCVTNANGLTLCSNKVGGAAWLDHQGYVICEGGCDAASALNCQLGISSASQPAE